MLRKTFSLLVLFPLTMLFIAVGWSCIEKAIYEDVYIKDIRFSGGGNQAHRVDTAFIDSTGGSFSISAYATTGCCFNERNPFISSCYAKNLIRVEKDSIIRKSISVSFDRGMVVGGTAIPGNTNVLDYPAFFKDDEQYGTFYISISDTLLDAMMVDTLPYITTCSCTTTSNKSFSKQLVVLFKK